MAAALVSLANNLTPAGALVNMTGVDPAKLFAESVKAPGPLSALTSAADSRGPISALTSAASGAVVKRGSPGAATGTDNNSVAAEATGDGTGNAVAKVKNIGDPLYRLAILFTEKYMNIFAPKVLNNADNSRILLNVIMLYAINYIFKYEVFKSNYEVLKEIRDSLESNKKLLSYNTLTISKDYLDIVHDAVENIKLEEEQNFKKEQEHDKMDNETNIANNEISFSYVKMVVDNSSGLSGGLFTTITSAIANIWKVMMMWTKPFAGLAILVGFIVFILFVFFGEDDDTSSSENSGGVGTGSLLGPSNFNIFSKNMQGSGGANNNTDIISVLQRLPQNIYTFFDKLSAAYSRFSKYANSSSDFLNSLSDTTPIIYDRPKQDKDNSDGLYDSIYTFDYKYINDISNAEIDFDQIIISDTGGISVIKLKAGWNGKYLLEPKIIINKPEDQDSVQANATLKTAVIVGTTPPLYEIKEIIITNTGSKYSKENTKSLIKIEDTAISDSIKGIENDETLVYNIKRPKKEDNPKISEYYGIQHEYMFDKGGTNNNEYIYAPKCGTNNNYVYDDCTVRIKECGKAKNEDTSDYKNIII